MSPRLKIALFALSTSLFTPVTAWAEAAPADETAASDGTEIIVSARRKDERLVDAPVAITAIGGAQLEDKAITRFTDIATQVPTMIAGLEALSRNGLRYPIAPYGIQADARAGLAKSYGN